MDDRKNKQYLTAYMKNFRTGADLAAFKDIVEAVEALPDEDEKDIIVLRYIKRLRWADIAYIMGCTERWAFEVHNRALEHISLQCERSGCFYKTMNSERSECSNERR